MRSSAATPGVGPVIRAELEVESLMTYKREAQYILGDSLGFKKGMEFE